MRKMKFIKAQDHLLIFLEIDNKQGEAGCDQARQMGVATDCTSFVGTGSTENYMKTELESLDTGAPEITYSGNEGPKSPQQIQMMQMAQQAMEQEGVAPVAEAVSPMAEGAA